MLAAKVSVKHTKSPLMCMQAIAPETAIAAAPDTLLRAEDADSPCATRDNYLC